GGGDISSRRSGCDKCKPMPVCTLVILAVEAQSGAEIFYCCGRLFKCFLPRLERTLQVIEFLVFELRLCERVPGVGIVGNDRDNALAQFNNCGLVFRFLSFLQLVSQLLKLRRFPGGESAASQQNKNGDRERSQVVRDLGHRDPKFKHFQGASVPCQYAERFSRWGRA